MTTENEHILTCEPCQYSTTNSSNFRRHASTVKHSKAADRVSGDDSNMEYQSIPTYVCVCGKAYTHRGSLYNHQLNCMNRTTQFSVVSKITNQCCESLECCESDKRVIHGLVAEYVSDIRKHMSMQMRRYLKRRDGITDPEVKRTLNEFYSTNITIESATKQITDMICHSGIDNI